MKEENISNIKEIIRQLADIKVDLLSIEIDETYTVTPSLTPAFYPPSFVHEANTIDDIIKDLMNKVAPPPGYSGVILPRRREEG